MSQFCRFGDSLEDMLRDCLVCGINDDGLQKRLLAEPDLTYVNAVDLAQRNETASQQVRDLRVGHTRRPINRMGDGSKTKELACFRCGRKGHFIAKCSEVVCRTCGNKGHLQRACNRSKRQAPKRQKEVKKVEQETHETSNLESDGSEDPLHVGLHATTATASTPPILVDLQLVDCQLSMVVDTGASMSLTSQTIYKKLWPKRVLSASEDKPCTYSQEPIKVLGCCIVYKAQTFKEMALLIVERNRPSLMGRNWLKEVTLDWHEIHCMLSQSLQAVLDGHRAVFQEGLGRWKPYSMSMQQPSHGISD